MPDEQILFARELKNYTKIGITQRREVKITKDDPMELNIPERLRLRGLGRREEFPE